MISRRENQRPGALAIPLSHKPEQVEGEDEHEMPNTLMHCP